MFGTEVSRGEIISETITLCSTHKREEGANIESKP